MIELGFTGTQIGMTDKQFKTVEDVVKEFGGIRAHHGDCVGADAQFHSIIRATKDSWIKIHPPVNESRRAFCEADEYAEPKEYLDRNTDIVLESELLIATPNTDHYVLRSGTWSTWVKALKRNMPTILVLPDGTIDEIQQKQFSNFTQTTLTFC